MNKGRRQRVIRSIRSFLSYFRYDLRRNIKSMIAVLLAIVILLFIAKSSVNPEAREEKTDNIPLNQRSFSLVNEDDSEMGAMFVTGLKRLTFLDKVYLDDMQTAIRRLDNQETVLMARIPEGLYESANSGKSDVSVEVWFSNWLKMESYYISTLIKQFVVSAKHSISSVFGFQKTYAQLSGNENKAWEETTKITIDYLVTVLNRMSFLQKNESPPFAMEAYILPAILLLLSSLPGIIVLMSTASIRATAYEDRLLLHCGTVIPLLSRLLIGCIWWILLVVPVLFVIRGMQPGLAIGKISVLLFGSFLSLSLFMTALGRLDTPMATLFQLGSAILFALLVLAGAIYPIHLFPAWLRRVAAITPLYYTMQMLYRFIAQAWMKVDIAMEGVLLTFWPIIPSALLAWKYGRRKV